MGCHSTVTRLIPRLKDFMNVGANGHTSLAWSLGLISFCFGHTHGTSEILVNGFCLAIGNEGHKVAIYCLLGFNTGPLHFVGIRKSWKALV